MAARLGNVIYWTCCGVAALWLVATAGFMWPTAQTATAPSTTSKDNIDDSVIPRSDARADELRRQGLNDRAIADELGREGLNPFAAWGPALPAKPKPSELDPSTARPEIVGFDWQAMLLLGFVPALLVWLFGRACRYVLAG
jgi:hypothetical protein